MKNKFPLLTQKTEVKVDKIYQWRGHCLITKPFENNTITLVCKKCFFKEKGLKCRTYCKNYFEFGYPYIYFRELSEIEKLILEGEQCGKKYKVGEVFKHNQDWLIVEKNKLCKGCYFDNKGNCEIEEDVLCISSDSEDSAPIIFKKINEIEALILKGSDKS